MLRFSCNFSRIMMWISVNNDLEKLLRNLRNNIRIMIIVKIKVNQRELEKSQSSIIQRKVMMESCGFVLEQEDQRKVNCDANSNLK